MLAELADEKMNPNKLILKKFNCRYLDGTYSTIGHVFSVMVEVLKIEKPSIELFIMKLNEYIEIGGDGFARVSKPTKYLYSRTTHKLARYLRGEFPNITKDQFDTIIRSAYPPHR